MSQSVFPHRVHYSGFALIKARYLMAKDGTEIEACLLCRTEQPGAIVQAHVPDKQKEITESVTNLTAKILGSGKKGVATQKQRN